MDFLKKNFDLCLFVLSIVLYICWHAFFPLLLFSFVLFWYKRELAWRIEKEKPKFFLRLFNLEDEPSFLPFIKFWFLGIVWSLLILSLMAIAIRDEDILTVYETFSTIFYNSVAYLYPGHVSSELAIVKQALPDYLAAQNINVVITDEIVQNELKKQDGIRFLLKNYHLDFVCLTVYAVIFARPLIMQPFYQVAMTDPNRQFHFKKLNLWRITINALFIIGLYYMFFGMPIHRENCAEIHNRAAWLCSNLATKGKYISFPARIAAYWVAILFIINLFTDGYFLKQEQNDDNANSNN